MKLSQIGELQLLEEIRKRFSQKSPGLLVGIGDDAAVMRQPRKNLLVTSDMMVEGVHFDLSFVTPYQLGFKLVSVNVSDIYAMGGKPDYLLIDMAMNQDTSEESFALFFEGVNDALNLYGAVLVGGDISAAGKGMSIAATLIGSCRKYILRSGAKLGDKIYVTGNLGDSACGLELLKRINRPLDLFKKAKSREQKAESKTIANAKELKGLTWNMVKTLLARHLLPVARDSAAYARHATSMIDISDGLLIDLTRLCGESRVGARIYEQHIPVSIGLKRAAACLHISPLQLALSGGEDYELLFTAPSGKKVKAIYIGDVIQSGSIIVDYAGNERTFTAEGYQHFRVRRKP